MTGRSSSPPRGPRADPPRPSPGPERQHDSSPGTRPTTRPVGVHRHRSPPASHRRRWEMVESGGRAPIAADFFSEAAAHLRQLHRDAATSIVPRGRPSSPRPQPRQPLPEGHISPKRWRRIVETERVRRHWEAYLLDYYPDGRPRPEQERAHLREEERARVRADVLYWIERYIWLQNPKARTPTDRVFPIVLWPTQREFVTWLVEGYQTGRERIGLKGRELGASWLSVAIIYHLWNTEANFKAKLGCYMEAMVDDSTTDSLFGKFRFILDSQPEWMRPPVRDREHSKHLQIQHPENGSVVTGGAASPSFGRGGRQSVVLTDEWAFYEPHVQAKIKLSLETVARSWWKISTPNGRGEDFHMTWTWVSEPRDRFVMSWRADPRRTESWFDGLLQENGGKLTYDQREQEHNCNFAAVLGLRVWSADRGKITYSDSSLPDYVSALPILAAMDFGSGPSLTVFGLAYVLYEFDEDGDPKPRIWLDTVLDWSRTKADVIADDITANLSSYPQSPTIIGDPAGTHPDSMQESWESNLQAHGVPIVCLPIEYNADYLITATIEDVQRMLESGRLLIHETRGDLVLQAIESWKWNVPDGVPLDAVRKDNIKPMKDRWSHPGDMLRYLVGYAIREGASDGAGYIEITPRMAERVPVEGGEQVSRAYDSMFRRIAQGPLGMPSDGHRGDGISEMGLADFALAGMGDFDFPVY